MEARGATLKPGSTNAGLPRRLQAILYWEYHTGSPDLQAPIISKQQSVPTTYRIALNVIRRNCRAKMFLDSSIDLTIICDIFHNAFCNSDLKQGNPGIRLASSVAQ